MLQCQDCRNTNLIHVGRVGNFELFACRHCGAIYIDPAVLKPRKEGNVPRTYQEIRGKEVFEPNNVP